MNTPSNVPPAPPLESRVAAPPIKAANDLMYWSIRRELWENRSLTIAPLAVAAFALFILLMTAFGLPHKMRNLPTLEAPKRHAAVVSPFTVAPTVIMVTTILVGIFYSLDALYGERRDRSILFWKSLPVSDTTTVLSKTTIPVVVLPLLAFAITVATQVAMLLLSSAVLLGSGMSAGTLWSHLPLFHMWRILFLHLVAGHGLWYAPIYGWLLLVSAWARRAPFLWAGLPLLAIGAVEKIAFNTSYFAAILQHRMLGGPSASGSTTGMSMDAMTPYTLGELLGSPGLWIGLAIAAAFLAGAVRLRRYRGPI